MIVISSLRSVYIFGSSVFVVVDVVVVVVVVVVVGVVGVVVVVVVVVVDVVVVEVVVVVVVVVVDNVSSFCVVFLFRSDLLEPVELDILGAGGVGLRS